MRSSLTMVFTIFIAAGCSGGHDDTDVPHTLTFAATVGGEPFGCGKTFSNVGMGHSTYQPLDFRMYIHDIRLVHGSHVHPLELEQDGKWQVDDIALIDFEDKSGLCTGGTTETRTIVTGMAPADEWAAVRFKVGVPFERNHGDAATAPSPLNLSELWWRWNGGYKFARIDGKTTTGTSPYFVHLGSTGCVPEGSNSVTSCSNPNVAEIELPIDPDTGTIDIDLGRLFAETDLDNDPDPLTPGCMSEPTDRACAGVFKSFGLDVATGAPTAGQTLFGAL